MKNLAGVILALFDLVEAEGRLLQVKMLHTVRSCLWFALGVIFAGAALAFFLAAAFDWMLTVISRPAAFAITGMASAAISIVFIAGAYLCLRTKTSAREKSQTDKARN